MPVLKPSLHLCQGSWHAPQNLTPSFLDTSANCLRRFEICGVSSFLGLRRGQEKKRVKHFTLKCKSLTPCTTSQLWLTGACRVKKNACQEIEKVFIPLGRVFLTPSSCPLFHFFFPLKVGLHYYAHASYVPSFHVLACHVWWWCGDREGEVKRRSESSFVMWS